jgi:lysophospholipase L1-like esterase
MRFTERIKEKNGDMGHYRPLVIGFLGDSVTQGCFELYKTKKTDYDTEFRSYEAYHTKLNRMLQEVFPRVSITTVNAGVSGDKAPGGAERLDRDILSFSPDLVVVCYGLNDVVKGDAGLEEYGQALEEIFRKLKAADVETIFMTPNMVGERAVAEETDPFMYSVLEEVAVFQSDGTMDRYMEKAREVCKNNDIPVCDCYRKWKKLRENGVDVTRLLSNRINHPSENMHWMFAVSLFEMIMDF